VLRSAGLIASVIGGVIATIRHAEAAGDGGATHPVVLAAVVVVLFALVFGLTLPKVAAWRIPGSRLLGALTYPLYLSHATFGYALLDLWVDPESIWPGIAVAFACVLVTALCIHLGVERIPAPLWRALFRLAFSPVGLLERRRRSGSAPTATMHAEAESR
jgi:peptidoglycan/LPS O-acetylase OafA/YrhL